MSENGNSMMAADARRVAQEDVAGCAVACLAMVSGRTYAEVRVSLPETQRALLTVPGTGGLSDHAILWWLNFNGFWSRRSWPDGEWSRPTPTRGLTIALTHDAHWVVLADGVVLDPARQAPLPSYSWRQFIEVLPPARPCVRGGRG